MKLQINILGQGFVDIYESTSIALTDVNIIYAVDGVQMSRTSNIKLPRTANNDKLFGFAYSPAQYGSAVRKTIAVQVMFESIPESGFLHITSVTETDYNAVITFGENTKLKALKEAGNIGEYMNFAETVYFFTGNGTEANLDPSNYGIWEKVDYRNGHEEVLLNAQDSNVTYPTAAPLPSIDLHELIQRCCQHFGITFQADNHYIRLTPPRVQVLTSQSVTFRNVSNKLSIDGLTDIVAEPHYFGVSRRPPTIFNQSCFVPAKDITIKFSDSLQSDLRLARSNGIDSQEYLSSGSLAGQSFELKAGIDYFFTPDGAIVDGILASIVADYNIAATIESDGEVTNYGITVSLQGNLPQFKLLDLIKYYAAMIGGLITFDGSTLSIITGMPFDTSKVCDLMGRLIDYEVERNFADYAQRNYVQFRDEQEPVVYAVNNSNLNSEQVLLEVPISRGEPVANTDPRYGSDAEALIRDSNFEDGKITYNNDYWSAFRIGNTWCGAYLGTITNEYLQLICSRSVGVKARVKMSLVEYMQLSNDTIYYIAGTYCVCASRQYSDGIVTLNLSRAF